MKYKELFLRLRKSTFIRPLSPGQEIRFLKQADKENGRPPFLHHYEDKNGRGKELFYGPDGKPILEVNLRCGKPHGRAKMYDENSIRIFPNTYWYYGEEITSVWALDHFHIYEEEEQQIPKEKIRARDKVYEADTFKTALYGYAALEGIQKPNFKVLAKQRRENQR